MDNSKSQQVIDSIHAAVDYCRLLEEASKSDTPEFMLRLQQLLPRLYSFLAGLSKPKYCYDEDQKNFVGEKPHERLMHDMQNKFGIRGIAKVSPAMQTGVRSAADESLAGDLVDLYRSLKNFSELYKVGLPQAMNDAVWICCSDFQQDMGPRLLDSLKALHTLIYYPESAVTNVSSDDGIDPSDEDDEPWFASDQEEV